MLDCKLRSAPVFCLLRYGGFLEEIGTEVEVNPTINTNFYQYKDVIMRRFQSRDYNVTFPRVFPIGLGALDTLTTLYTLVIEGSLLVARIIEVGFVSSN